MSKIGMHSLLTLVALAAIFAMLLVACVDEEEPTATTAAGQPATPTVEAMMEEATATPVPVPTATPRPTAAPTPTATLIPTPVPTATPTPSPTMAPTATHTPTPVPTVTRTPTATTRPRPRQRLLLRTCPRRRLRQVRPWLPQPLTRQHPSPRSLGLRLPHTRPRLRQRLLLRPCHGDVYAHCHTYAHTHADTHRSFSGSCRDDASDVHRREGADLSDCQYVG